MRSMRLSLAALLSGVAVPAFAVDSPTYRHAGQNLPAQGVILLDQSGNYVAAGGSGTPTTVAGSQEQDVTATATLNAASTSSQQTYTLNGQSTLSFAFSGLTASGATVSFFQSNDWNGTTGTFTPVGEVNTGTGIASLTRTTDGQSAIGVEGSKALRVQVTTAGAGTITLATNISVRSRYAALRAPLPPGTNTVGAVTQSGTWTSAQGAAAAVSGAWPVYLAQGGAPNATGNPIFAQVTNFPATQPVSGTVTANQGTSPWVVSGTINAAQSGAYTVTQGPAGTAAWKVDGSGVTQPVSNAGTFAVQNNAPIPAGTNTIGAVNQGTSPWTIGGTVTANLGTLNGASTAALQSSTQGTVAPGTAAAASILAGQVYNATAPAPTNGQGLALQSDAAGNLKINNSTLSPGAATAANQVAGTSVNGTAQVGGVTPLSRLPSSAATTNATIAKAAPGRVYRIFGCNTTTAPVYLKLYNTASTPVPGTTAVFLSRPFPASGTAGALNCIAFDVADIGWYLSAGIGYALTTGGADTDATAPAAGAVVQLSVDGL